jgi:hypothetical protein
MTRLFLADARLAETAIHAAYAHYDAAAAQCDRLEAADYQAVEAKDAVAAICYLVQAERLANKDAFTRIAYLHSVELARRRAFAAAWPPEIRWYVEGRVYSALPPGAGQDLKKALVALAFLQQAHPGDTTVMYWNALAFDRQGNHERARELFRSAANAPLPDARARAVESQIALGYERPADGLRTGIEPGIFFNAQRGFGGALTWEDDRLFDRRRGLQVEGDASTKGQYGISVQADDTELYSPLRLTFYGRYSGGTEDFFGLGMESPSGSPASIDLVRTELRLGATVPFDEATSLTVGWRSAGAVLRGMAPAGLDFGFADGPFGQLVFDTRNSRRNPVSGTLVDLRGFFPTQGLGSGRTFREWTARAESYYRIRLRHTLALTLGAVLLDGDAPFSSFPALAGSVPAPGVREGRYRDRNVAAAAVEYRWRVWQTTSVAAFATTGTAGPDAGNLPQGVWKVGAGLAWIGHFSRYATASPRVELAVFGGETVFQGAIGVQW